MAYTVSPSYAAVVASNAGYASSAGYAAASTYRTGGGSAYAGGGGGSIPGVCRQTCVRYGSCTCKG